MTINNQDLTLFRHQAQHPKTSDREIDRFEWTRQTRFQAMRKETQDITLTTREGDTVTIDASSLMQASYIGFDYSQKVKDGIQSAQMEKMTLASKNSFSMTVQGDLSEEEQQDIRDVVDKLNDAMKKLVNGDVQGLASMVPGLLDDAETLSGLQAMLKFEQRVSVEQQTRTMMQWQGAGPKPEFSPRDPESQQSQNPDNPFASGKNLIAKIAGKMMEMLDSSKVESDKLTEPVKNYFAQLLKSFQAEAGENSPVSQFVQQLGDEMARWRETPKTGDTPLPA